MSNNNKNPIQKSVRILLINDDQKLLLMCANDPKTTSRDGSYYGRFWFPIGGEIEPGESLIEAATRELKEETGLNKEDVTFGPIVWWGNFEMVINGMLTKVKQKFIIAHTKNKSITLKYLTSDEKKVIEKIQWMSFEQICNHNEVIYPVVLKDYLPNILNKNYPTEPIWIDLGKNP
ncbi:MAG: NUDIX domain-containing protein [Chlamydiota bacterium]|jgi:8-oxo-dGTP pyrophosphatase MutT (NUDIX family)